jgi:hypothetical protein
MHWLNKQNVCGPATWAEYSNSSPQMPIPSAEPNFKLNPSHKIIILRLLPSAEGSNFKFTCSSGKEKIKEFRAPECVPRSVNCPTSFWLETGYPVRGNASFRVTHFFPCHLVSELLKQSIEEVSFFFRRQQFRGLTCSLELWLHRFEDRSNGPVARPKRSCARLKRSTESLCS